MSGGEVIIPTLVSIPTAFIYEIAEIMGVYDSYEIEFLLEFYVMDS